VTEVHTESERRTGTAVLTGERDGTVVALPAPHMPSTPGDPAAALPLVPAFAYGYEPGAVIAQRYRLLEPVGFGGMGTVWRAHDETLDVPVAVKLLRSTVHPSGSSERLFLEAKAAACLHHPAIVRVFDFGVTDAGDPFLAMELLQGESFREVLDRNRVLPAPEAIRLLLPIVAGLACAHGRGIVHRDLKPDNIFLATDDASRVEPKIVDFGIAKFEGSSSRLTTAGVLLGSPSYMSPEQSMGESDIDARADIWSVAVVLYEAIAGRTPWEAPNCPALLRAIVDDPPPSLIGFGGVDAELWSVIERALAKRREDRWPSARAIGEALALWLGKQGVAEDVTGTSLRTAWLTDGDAATRTGSTASIPPVSAAPTMESPASTIAPLHAVARLLRSTARGPRRLALGVGLPLVACLTLFQMGFGPSHVSPISRATAGVALASSTPSEPIPSSDMTDAAKRSHAPTADRPSKVPGASPSAHATLAKPSAARRGSARAMDFGF
jgi:serine/threonine-protein kinase